MVSAHHNENEDDIEDGDEEENVAHLAGFAEGLRAIGRGD